ncbi:MAG: hypothetical protein FWD15_02140 [Alphaproteobacteria bacterium]|nr:hypothetical protein [Alphaproteobacteria bacterium]
MAMDLRVREGWTLWIIIVLAIAALWFAPEFIKINDHRDRIATQVEAITGYKPTIEGDISFAILPRPYIKIENISFAGDNGRPFMRARTLRANLNPRLLIGHSEMFSSVAVYNPVVDIGEMGGDGAGVWSFIGTNKIKRIRTYNMTVMSGGAVRATNANLEIDNTNARGALMSGSLTVGSHHINSVYAALNFENTNNYKVEFSVRYSKSNTFINAKGETNVVNGEKRTDMAAEITTPSLVRFMNDPEFMALPFLDRRLKASANIRIGGGTISLANGKIASDDVAGTFSGSAPIRNGVELGLRGAEIKAELTTLRAAAISPAALGFSDLNLARLATMDENVQRILSNVKLDISARRVGFRSRTLTNFALVSAPRSGGIEIEKFAYSEAGKLFTASGFVSTWEGGFFSGHINSNVPIKIENNIAPDVVVESFVGNIKSVPGSIEIARANVIANGERFVLYAKARDADGGREYDITVDAETLDLRRFLGARQTNMDIILSTLGRMADRKISLNANVRNLITSDGRFANFSTRAKLDDGDLNIASLRFAEGGGQSEIRGTLADIAGEGAAFRELSYRLRAADGGTISIPIVRHDFLNTFVGFGARDVEVKLNGEAGNPDVEISSSTPNFAMAIRGKLLSDSMNFQMDFSHNELKGFLFTQGHINQEIAEYLYDGIPFRLITTIKDGAAENATLEIRSNIFRGKLGSSNRRTFFDLETDRLDLREIFKRVNEDYGYANMLLKIIRAMPYDMKISAAHVMNYGGAQYRDFSLELQNSRNPGRAAIAFIQDGSSVNIASSITNGRIFAGSATLRNYSINGSLFERGDLNIADANIDADLEFSTSGATAAQIIQNLGGTLRAIARGGTVIGISGIDGIFDEIGKLANITTNNVAFVLEHALKSGAARFDSLSISGPIRNAAIDGADIALLMPDMRFDGKISFDILRHMMEINGMFSIVGLAVHTLGLEYQASGFIERLEREINKEPIAARVSISMLEKRRRGR